MPVPSTEMSSEPSAAETFAAAREARTDESEVKKLSAIIPEGNFCENAIGSC